jgi:hypothetical protein
MASQTHTKVIIASAVTVNSVSPITDLFKLPLGNSLTYQATVTGSGSVAANVLIEVSNDGIGWLSDGSSTLALTGTTTATSGYTSVSPWQFVRATISGITGTSAAVTVSLGG